MKRLACFFIYPAFVLLPLLLQAQNDTSFVDKLAALPDKFYGKLNSKIDVLNRQFDSKSDKLLLRIEKSEARIYRKLWKKDSAAAKELMGDARQRYTQLKGNAKDQAQRLGRFSQLYSGKLDSLSTALNFMGNNSLVPDDLKDRLSHGSASIKGLQDRFNETDIIRKYLKERRQLLAAQLEKFGLTKQLKQLNKQIYYYQQQVKEFRELWENPDKLTARLLGVIQNIPAFKDFFAKNSQLASLFNSPGSAANNPASLAGLQTRASVLLDLQARFGNSPAAQQILQQNLQDAQSQLNTLKNKISQYLPQGGSNDDILPQGFKPNLQKTKTFWQRLEYGTNVQSQKPNGYFPVTTDIGLSLGYKLNEKSVIGIGASYKMGWGQNIRNINITHQGAGLRSFGDVKLKGSFGISGGYEMNYRNEFNRVEALRDLTAWQQSGLLGLSKVVSLNNKFFRKTKLQLLWDFLSYEQVPRTQPLVVRIGYSFK